MAETDETQEAAQDAIEDAIDKAAEKRAAEAEATARADEREKALEARLAALEARGGPQSTFDPSTIGTAITEALSPVTETLTSLGQRIEAIEANAKVPDPTPEPEKEADPFAPQIDLQAAARYVPEGPPRIKHTLFRRLGRG